MDKETKSFQQQGRVLFLFSPKFQEFGADVAGELVSRKVCRIVDGICTGGDSVVDRVKKRLDMSAGQLWNLEAEELRWVDQSADIRILRKMEDELGQGVVGRTITSDRRIGYGLVSGGWVRPSWISRHAAMKPVTVPVNYVAGLYIFLDEVIRHGKPRLVFLYGVAGAPAFLLGQMCMARNIPILRLVSSRVEARMIIDNDPIGRFVCIKNAMARECSGLLDLTHERRWAREYLESFRKQPSQPEYYKYNITIRKEREPVCQFLRAVKSSILLLSPHKIINDPYHMDRIHRAWFQVVIAFRRVTITKKYFTHMVPGNFRWIYFPLQFEPEASTMVLSPWHTNQFAVIEVLAKALPADCILIVKEHASMLGSRPREFYRKIASIPRVVLVDNERPGLWWIQQSSVTVVISGTSAWEAVRFGKPVVVIGDTPFLAIGEGMVHEPCLSNLSAAFREAMEQLPASDESLERFLAALRASSFEMKPSLLWGEYSNHTDEEQINAVQNVCDGIMERLEESIN